MRVLIVEDEIIAANYLKEIVCEAGYEVVGIVGTGRGAIELARSQKPDLILMDIMLKDAISGVDAAIEISYLLPECMIAFLTAYSETSMIESAKDANAVGYFLKPYNKEEIAANLKILTPQTSSTPSSNKSSIPLAKDYRYDMEHRALFLHSQEITLTQKELDLVSFLCKNRHQVLSFGEILSALWHDNTPHQTLRSLICRIRKKTHSDFIISINKRGYKLSLPS